MSRQTETRSQRKLILQQLREPYTYPEHWKSFEQVADGGMYAAIDACMVALQEVVQLNECESYWADVMQDLRKRVYR